jgi:hypothetical protein
MTIQYTYVGVVAPSTLTINVAKGNSSVDLSTVTAVSLDVTKPGTNVPTTWAASITTQTATTLRASHTFASGELDLSGCYKFVVLMAVPSGTVRAGPGFLEVLK